MKKLTLLFIVITAMTANAQVGKAFPELKGINLNDKPFTIPTDCKGKQAIICVAYSKRAEEALSAWLNPMYNQFLAKTGLMDDAYEVELYFVPMFTGRFQPTENMAKKQLQEGTGKEYYDHVICYHGNMREYKETLELDEKEFPYFFVLDKDGIIIHATKGFYSEKKLEELADKLE